MIEGVRNRDGFTLIELIATIAIIGIISIIIVPRITDYSGKSKVSKSKANLIILKNAVQRFNLEHSVNLNTIGTNHKFNEDAVKESLIKKTKSDGTIDTVLSNNILGPYLDSIPKEWADYSVDDLMVKDPNEIDDPVSDFNSDGTVKQ